MQGGFSPRDVSVYLPDSTPHLVVQAHCTHDLPQSFIIQLRGMQPQQGTIRGRQAHLKGPAPTHHCRAACGGVSGGECAQAERGGVRHASGCWSGDSLLIPCSGMQ